MVQGESGGRAISNEDYAILYRAIWGGSGGPSALGSFKRLKETVDFLRERNEKGIKYADYKNGQNISNRMIRYNRAIRRQSPSTSNDVEESELFSLSKELSGQVQSDANVSKTIDRIYYPRSLSKVRLGNKDSNITDINRDANPEATRRLKSRFARYVGNPLLKILPPIKREERKGSNRIARTITFNRLDEKQRNKILNDGKQALIKQLVLNGTIRQSIFDELNRFGSSDTVRLGDAIANNFEYRTTGAAYNQNKNDPSLEKDFNIARSKYTSRQKNLLDNIIIEMYNNRNPEKAK
jgi:hypothetical protein